MNKYLTFMLGLALIAACGDGQRSPGQDAARTYDKTVLARGERVYVAHCAQCHGPNGEAKPDWRKPDAEGKYPPPPLDDSGHAWHHRRAWLTAFIRQGSPAGQGNMPAWGGKLTEQEIDDVVTWITSLWSDQIYLEWRTKIEQPGR